MPARCVCFFKARTFASSHAKKSGTGGGGGGRVLVASPASHEPGFTGPVRYWMEVMGCWGFFFFIFSHLQLAPAAITGVLP